MGDTTSPGSMDRAALKPRFMVLHPSLGLASLAHLLNNQELPLEKDGPFTALARTLYWDE